ncbi:MAG: hypothetical protein MK078_15030 [Crocinitomicaceae bacterium]|nr:hypothetical protein [Crocinitomicaceae bacterium]
MAVEIIDDINNNPNDDQVAKNRAIVAHITIIGWVIALVQNNADKKEFASFYIRQMLGLILLSVAGAMFQVIFIGYIISMASLVFWILSLIGSINGQKSPTPLIGEYFQDWFKTL